VQGQRAAAASVGDDDLAAVAREYPDGGGVEVRRQRLLDAAEMLFQAQGVSQTTLQQIAQAANATRGAVYWHFKDKADLFNAMMDRVTLPLEAANRAGIAAADEQPLAAVERSLLDALRLITTNPQVRRVFDIATRKIEYTDEMDSVRRRHLESRQLFLTGFEQALKANNIKYERYLYPGTQHGFHNDTTPRYNAEAAKLAWQRTVAFFNKNVR
jgi:AcrR family transcriptional regulator